MNIKKLLIEKERVAYTEHKPELAEFFDMCLQPILRLEEEINVRDAAHDGEVSAEACRGANT